MRFDTHGSAARIVASVLAVTLGALASNARAQLTPAEAFFAISIREAREQEDDSRVHLEGRLSEERSDGHYQLEDDTGIIDVEIDDVLWPDRMPPPPETRVQIEGELDVDPGATEVEVDRVRILE